MSFPIEEVTAEAGDSIEQLGTKRKFWFDDKRRLFKEGRPGTGENWAEKVACEICTLLGLPHAHYELARWNGREGVVTASFVPEGCRWVAGNELLSRIFPGYEQQQSYQRREHRVASCLAVCIAPNLLLPRDYDAPPAIKTGADVIVGYLMLDCLIGNQDRHDENWGLVWCAGPPPRIWLAPTFDHASSLGRNESDEKRRFRLESRDPGASVAAYSAKARSAFYEAGDADRPIGTLRAFESAAKLRKKAAKHWLDRLERCSSSDFEAILRKVPSALMSETAGLFALRMLEANRERLLKSERWLK